MGREVAFADEDGYPGYCRLKVSVSVRRPTITEKGIWKGQYRTECGHLKGRHAIDSYPAMRMQHAI